MKKHLNNYYFKPFLCRMRKEIGRIFLIVFIFTGLNTFAQQSLINITLYNSTVEKAIDELRKQTDYSFIYNHEELEKAPHINVRVSKVTIEEALREILKNTGLTYEKVNNTLIIKPEEKPLKNQTSTPENTIKQNVRGTVLDKDSKSSLPFANVFVLNTDPVIGTTTDLDGNFIIKDLPIGRYSLKVSYIGYSDGLVSGFLHGSGKETILTIELTEQVQTLGDVIIQSDNTEPLNEMATVSARSFDSEETKRYAASISDPARMVQVFAGVSGTDDASNEIVIRGNSPHWMLWKLEGVEIPSPNHFAEEGYTSGAVSILSTNMLGNSDFYTGAFPADYGNALSGVFDLNLRKGNNRKNEFTIQAGVLGIDLSAEGPFKKGYDGSFLFNYRYATLSLLNNFNIEVSENALPNYQDLSYKFHLPTKKSGNFSFWGIGGLSDVDEKYIPNASEPENFQYGYSDVTNTGMYATGLTHNYFPDNKSYIQTVISKSMSFSSEDYQTMTTAGLLHGSLYDSLQKKAIRFSSFYNRKLSGRTTVRVGGIVNLLGYNYFSKTFDDNTQIWNKFMDSEGNTSLYQWYVQAKYKFTDKVVLTGGLHYSYFALSADQSLEPRLGLTFAMKNQQKLGFGLGQHSRHENLLVYFVDTDVSENSEYLPNKNLDLTKANHFVVSYERMIRKNLNIKTEAYYQYIPNLPVPVNPEKFNSPAFGGLSVSDTLDNIGKAKNYGVELTLQKYFSNDYYFLFSSSLFESKYQPANGEWMNSKYNVNYINNLVGGKEFPWKENKMIGFNAKIIWSGGKRLVPIDLEASKIEGKAVYNFNEIYSTKGKDYFRTDIGVKLHIYKERTQHVISLDIQNVTNRLNTWAKVYDDQNEKIIDYPMAGLIPILNYRFEF